MKRIRFLSRNIKGSVSVKYTWLELFFVILLATLIYSLTANNYSTRKIEDNFDKLNLELYKKMQMQFDTMLNSFSQTALELATDADIAALAMQRDDSAPHSQITAMEHALANKSVIMRNAEDYHIYFSRSGMIGSTDGLFGAQEYFETHYSYLNLRDSEWRRWIVSDAEKEYIAVTGTDGRQYLLLKYPLSGTVREIVSSSLIVVLEESCMLRFARDIPYFESSMIYLTDSDGETLFCLKPEGMETLTNGALNKSADTLRLAGKRFRVIRAASANTGWQFVFCVPSNIYRGDLSTVNFILYAMLLLCICLEIFVLWRSYNRSYSPLKGIVGMIGNGEEKGNELEAIRKSIVQMMDAKKEYSSLIDEQKAIIRNNYLYLLMSGVLGEREMKEEVWREKGVEFIHPFFMTASLSLMEYSELFYDLEEPIDDSQRFDLMKLIVENIYSDIAAKYGLHSYFVAMGRNCFILLNLAEKTDKAAVLESFRETQQAVQNHFDVHFAVALSGIYRGLYGVPNTYKEALEGLDYIELIGEPGIVEYEEAAGDRVAQYRLEYDFYNAFFKFIKQQQGEEAYRLVKQRLDEKLYAAAPYRAIAYMVYDVVNHILGQFQEYLEDSEPVECLFRMTLASREDIEKAEERIGQLIFKICSEISARADAANLKEAKHKAVAQKVRETIDRDYRNTELNVTGIADRLGFSRAYISGIFQEQYGEGVLDYLNRVRYEKAREMILTTNLTLTKIAEATGFVSISTFNRVFKKYEGISPGAFRKQYLGY